MYTCYLFDSDSCEAVYEWVLVAEFGLTDAEIAMMERV